MMVWIRIFSYYTQPPKSIYIVIYHIINKFKLNKLNQYNTDLNKNLLKMSDIAINHLKFQGKRAKAIYNYKATMNDEVFFII